MKAYFMSQFGHYPLVWMNNSTDYQIYTSGQLRNSLKNEEADAQPAITCSKLTTETLEQGVKHVQS